MSLLTNLLHYYACDANTGTSLASSLGSSNKTGTFNGNATWGTALAGAACVSFPGASGGYGGVSCAAASGLANATAATYSMWLKLTHSDDYSYGIYASLYEGSANSRFEMHGGVAGDSKDIWCNCGNGSNSYGIAANAIPDFNNWHHVAMVFDGTQTGNANRLKLYVDGAEVTLSYTGTIPSSLPNLTTYGVNFGRRFDSSGPGKHDMDEVGIWNRALTADEVLFLFQLGTNIETFPCPPDITNPATSPTSLSGDYMNSSYVASLEGWSQIDVLDTYEAQNTWSLSGPDTASLHLEDFSQVSQELWFNDTPPAPGNYDVTVTLTTPGGSDSVQFLIAVTGLPGGGISSRVRSSRGRRSLARRMWG